MVAPFIRSVSVESANVQSLTLASAYVRRYFGDNQKIPVALIAPYIAAAAKNIIAPLSAEFEVAIRKHILLENHYRTGRMYRDTYVDTRDSKSGVGGISFIPVFPKKGGVRYGWVVNAESGFLDSAYEEFLSSPRLARAFRLWRDVSALLIRRAILQGFLSIGSDNND